MPPKSIFKQAPLCLKDKIKNFSCSTCKTLDTKLTVTAYIKSICTGQVLTHLQHRVVLCLLCNSNIARFPLKRLYLLTCLLCLIYGPKIYLSFSHFSGQPVLYQQGLSCKRQETFLSEYEESIPV